MKILTVIGARPQFIKAGAVSRAFDKLAGVEELLVHTGQHYDHGMSQVFFDELELRKPHHHLGSGPGSHASQTGKMIETLGAVMEAEKPDCVLVYGDTNSTLAGALTASKLHIPLVHIEAGLRSYNKSMPEEINRVMTDHLSTLLFAPTVHSITNLSKEGIRNHNSPINNIDNPGVFLSGDVMYDSALYYREIAQSRSQIKEKYNLGSGPFVLATIHRDINSDNEVRLLSILEALRTVGKEIARVILPLHPRTRKMIGMSESAGKFLGDISTEHILIIDPVSYLDMVALESSATMVITDSGGVQKEAYFFGKPCIILRAETEWTELTNSGNAIIADADTTRIVESAHHFAGSKSAVYKELYGNGNAAAFIASTILEKLG